MSITRPLRLAWLHLGPCVMTLTDRNAQGSASLARLVGLGRCKGSRGSRLVWGWGETGREWWLVTLDRFRWRTGNRSTTRQLTMFATTRDICCLIGILYLTLQRCRYHTTVHISRASRIPASNRVRDHSDGSSSGGKRSRSALGIMNK